MGSDLSGFFQQLPLGIFVMFCGASILLIVAIVLIIRARAQRSSNLPSQPGYVQAPGYIPSGSDGDLPDLAMLTDTRSLAKNSPPASSSPKRVTTPGRFNVHLVDGRSVEAVEVMTVLRDVVDGGLIVQMGDNAYEQFSEGEAKQRFMKVMRELSIVVKPGAKSPEVPIEPAPPVESSEEVVESEPVPPPKPKAPSIPPPPVNKSGAMPGDLPKFSLDDNIIPPPKGVLNRVPKPEKPVPELDIAGAIEAYLQHKLRYTPEYEGRSIHVHPAPGGGVSIEVDGLFYDAVSDVADTEVREFLSATIQEWQQRH